MNQENQHAPVMSARAQRHAERAQKIARRDAIQTRIAREQSANVLTKLADQYGSDKGSKKHRYTELYHMLFHKYRNEEITFLEMGLMVGGPELGFSVDRDVKEPPSIQMWLEYFPKAHIHGLDVSDFSAHQTDRFTFHRCDMDERENIEAAAANMPAFDIILDDASHASTHQQDGFLTLFDRVKPGGLYLIEDLRWQPAPYEAKHARFTKTAALFQSYLDDGQFKHSDRTYARAFNAVRSQISGCFLFQAHFQKSRADQIVVIHKSEAAE